MQTAAQKIVNRPSPPMAAMTPVHVRSTPGVAQPAGSLKVSSPADPAEREAEHTAKRIMRMPMPQAEAAVTAKCSPHAARFANTIRHSEPISIARKQEGAATTSASLASEISASQSSGMPLPSGVRKFMEPRFNADFSQVRIHTGEKAAKLNRQVSAQAFTVGKQVFFGKNRFRPESNEGRELIAHELTHTIQQGAVIQRSPLVGTTNTPPLIQRSWLDPLEYLYDKAVAYISENAAFIPGFTMLTVVIGYNPITRASVDRSAGNILRGAIEMIPGGAYITQALNNHGVFDKVSVFAAQQFAALSSIGSNIWQDIKQFIKNFSITDLRDPGAVWQRAKNIVTAPIGQIKAFAIGLKNGIVQLVKDAILKPIAAFAKANAPNGYDLLCAVLGKDPISGDPVPRTAETLIGPFMKLIGQEAVWQKMQETRAIAKAWAWFQNALGAVKGFVQQIPGLFITAFRSLEIMDIVLLPRAFAKLVGVFGGFVGNFISWAGNALWNLLEIIFDVVKPGAMAWVKRAGAAFKSILKNPLPFVGNLAKAAKLGFGLFADNIGEHLKNGLIEWLTGALDGVYIPKALSLGEIGKFALSVLGITWAKIRAKIVKALGDKGETIVSGIEKGVEWAMKGFEIVKKLATGGAPAAWEMIQEKLTELKDMVIGGIKDFVIDSIIKKAVPKLIAMFIPGAGFVSAIISIVDIVMVIVEKMSKIVAVVTGFINSIMQIAAGNIRPAAIGINNALAGVLSFAISLFAGFVGLGKVTDKINGVINKGRDKVDKAIDAGLAWVVNKAKALFAKVFGKKDKKDDRTEEQKMVDLKKAVDEGQKLASDKKTTKRKLKKSLERLKSTYKLTSIDLVTDQQDKSKETVHVHAVINPTYDGSGIVLNKFPPEPTVVIEAMVGAPLPVRSGMEKKVLESPGKAGLPGHQRAHLLGPGLGADAPQGIFYAPKDVNLKLQNAGIEHMIREMYAQRYQGAELRVSMMASPHSGTEILAKANYKLYGRFPGENWSFIFEYTIKVGLGASPAVKVLAGDADMDAVHRFSAGAASVIKTRGV